jgi:hypothetical protein
MVVIMEIDNYIKSCTLNSKVYYFKSRDKCFKKLGLLKEKYPNLNFTIVRYRDNVPYLFCIRCINDSNKP